VKSITFKTFAKPCSAESTHLQTVALILICGDRLGPCEEITFLLRLTAALKSAKALEKELPMF